ncbi:tapasin-related protein isoform X2 [Microcaecilia unicolor]|uniref:Tapasin-related protein isoform X2 n=1 Tax=Microcaecilia unicolor TaxID=1415580 RepID=A0A6P7WLE1_9AMPH|nr:tapasin-related protein isoform X2 [Microcaecilia unicolor]
MTLSPSVKAGCRGSVRACLCFCLWQFLFTEGAEDTTPSSQMLRAVNLVLDCTYVSESAGHGGMFPGGFTREKALLVLRNVSVPEHESLDSITDFQPQPVENEAMIFEATVTDVEIPESEALLHADCNGQEVSCEISQYFRHKEGKAGSGEEENTACFISSIHISGNSFSVTVVMKTIPYQNDSVGKDRWHPRLKVPLSPRGTITMTVAFAVFTHTPSIRTQLGNTVKLDCGLKLSAADVVSVEWWRQHKGSGRSIYMYQPGTANRETTGPWMDIQNLQDSGDASLFIEGLGVKDEGTYICLVSTTHYNAQQIIQVLVIEPPKVKLYSTPSHEGSSRSLLTCEINNYYPLDVHVKWGQKVPENEGKLIEISESYSTSHRENHDGTFTVSSIVSVTVPSPEERGTTYTCSVSHVSLQVPITASLHLASADVESFIGLAGVSLATVIFIVFCCFLSSKRRDEGRSQCREQTAADTDTATPHVTTPQHKKKQH